MLCGICGVNEVKTENDFCTICHFSGKRFETFLLDDDRANVLGRIRKLPRVTQATIWHHGDNLFQLGVMLDDGRLVAPGFALASPNGIMVAPGVPPMLDRWAVAIIDERQEGISVLNDSYSDEELVEVIEKISEGTLPIEAERIVI